MMDIFERKEIEEIPLSTPRFRRKVESFLQSNGLRLEDVDVYLGVLGEDGEILAGGGIRRDIIKCIAVDDKVRSEGLAAPVVSRLISVGAANGYDELRVFTKVENAPVFESLGFHIIARAPKAVLMENGRGLERYKEYLRGFACEGSAVIVMNADPFTLGHEYLVRQAAERCEKLFVIPVSEDQGRFPSGERLGMIRACAGEYATVLNGSSYCISAATFPTYFLKDLSDAAETQMRLDLDLFANHIAPSLGATVRFVGSEPFDPLTERYNAMMKEVLPEVCVIPRLCDSQGPVSASRVRLSLDKGRYQEAAALTPSSVHPALLAELMGRALRMELEERLKPGLVTPDGKGSHQDMDYHMMSGSIDVMRRSFVSRFSLAENDDIISFGKAVEKDVLDFTGGVNTHRGAIFCLGLAALATLRTSGGEERLREEISSLASRVTGTADSHGGRAVRQYGVKGALDMALDGYAELFDDWLPFYRNVRCGEYALPRTLLRIMSTLDDTCVIHRAGIDSARLVKEEAAALLEDFSAAGMAEMNARFVEEGISPGGAADMLTLTIFIDSIIN